MAPMTTNTPKLSAALARIEHRPMEERTWKDDVIHAAVTSLTILAADGALARLESLVPDGAGHGGVHTLATPLEDAQAAARPDAAPCRVSAPAGESCPECGHDDTAGELGTGGFECHHCGWTEIDPAGDETEDDAGGV